MIDTVSKLDRLLLTRREREVLAELDEAIRKAKCGLARERVEPRQQEAVRAALQAAGMLGG